MAIMERYKIRESIKDVVAILDSAPIHRDLVPDTNIVRLTNRAPIAHLAIERALKALISEAGGNAECTHGLHRLYRDLSNHNVDAYDYLTKAFDDAVVFFGYNINARGLRQFSSLDNYLSKVGTEKAFKEMRYWVIGESSKGDSAISLISLPIHRELLWAVWTVFSPKRRDTVSVRVERVVADTIQRQIFVSSEERHIEHPAVRYRRWVSENHKSHRDAIRDLVRRGFAAIQDPILEDGLRKAYSDLRQMKDPAVRYFVNTLTYLPKGSQRRNRDAVATIDWSSEAKVHGSVLAAGGSCLGFIERQADGAWAIQPLEQGAVQFTAFAITLADAKRYLVNRLTQAVTVVVPGGSRKLRMFSDGSGWPPERNEIEQESQTLASSGVMMFTFHFWDGNHGLSSLDKVSVKIVDQWDSRFASVFDGEVQSVEGAKVWLKGEEIATLA